MEDILYSDKFIVKMDTLQLFKNSMRPNMFNAHLFFRYYVVKCYLENNNVEYGFKLYNEMQQKRVAFKPQIPKEKANNEIAFKKLIENIKLNGFDESSPIIVNKKLKMFDGSHRLAIAMYLGIKHVPIKILKESENNDFCYDLDWFASQNMPEHIKIINLMKKEIESKYNIKFDEI